MRYFFLALVLAGSILGFGYPWAARQLSDAEVITRQVYGHASGFSNTRFKLSPPQSPYRIFLRMRQRGTFAPGARSTGLRVHGSSGGEVTFVSDVSFSAERGVTPQADGNVYEAFGGVLPVSEPAEYQFVFTKNHDQGLSMERVDMVVRGKIIEPDKRIQIAGFAAALLGLAGAALWGKVRRAADGALPGTKGAAKFSRALGVVSVLLVAGAGIAAYVYPWLEGSLSAQELGRYEIFDRPSGFRPVPLHLTPAQSPIAIRFELTPLGNSRKPYSRTDLAVTLSMQGEKVLESVAIFTNSAESPGYGPEPPGKIYTAGLKAFEVPKAGTYKLDARLSGPKNLSMRRIFVVFETGPAKQNPVVRVIAGLLLATGMAAAFLSWLTGAGRAHSGAAENPRWGRDAAR